MLAVQWLSGQKIEYAGIGVSGLDFKFNSQCPVGPHSTILHWAVAWMM